jgi:hypothetical protein
MQLTDARDAQTRIQLEFIEMPEMRLRREQVRRLLDLSSGACDDALAALVRSGFLTQSADGAFLRGAVRDLSRGPTFLQPHAFGSLAPS